MVCILFARRARLHALPGSRLCPPLPLQMGHATAEAVVRAGFTLVPYSLTGQSEAVAVGNVGVSGIPVELVGPSQRQEAIDKIKRCARGRACKGGEQRRPASSSC